jgi:hypothetical protein
MKTLHTPPIKRRLIASMIFDLDSSENHMYTPIINWSFNFTNIENPIEIVIKYAWQDQTINYPFNKKIKQIISNKIESHSKHLLKERFPNYKGKRKITNFYKSDFGKDLPFAKATGKEVSL